MSDNVRRAFMLGFEPQMTVVEISALLPVKTLRPSFQLMCDDHGKGTISSWSLQDELKELYIAQAERIREFASTGNMLANVSTESLIKTFDRS